MHGPADLRRYLNQRPDQFPTTVTKRLMMYALNRELEYYDMPEVRQIVRAAAASNYRFADLITGIVNSDAFRRQGPEAAPKGGKTPATKVASTVQRLSQRATGEIGHGRVPDEEASVPTHLPARQRRGIGIAVPGRHGSGRHGPGADRGRTENPRGILLSFRTARS